jgi:hypothetical protein
MLPVLVQVSPFVGSMFTHVISWVFLLGDDMAIQFFQVTKSDQGLV